jgi:hypothetical protein
LIGHFWPSGYSPSGSSSGANFTPETITNSVGHKIAYFAGYGCASARHQWQNALANKQEGTDYWVTHYYVTGNASIPILKYAVNLDNEINIDLYSERTDPDGDSMLDNAATAGRTVQARDYLVEQFKPGNIGTRFSAFLNQIKNK